MRGEILKKVMIIIGCILSLIIVLLGYAYYISYYHLEVTSYVIDSDKITDEVRIVMISDVHDEHCKIKSQVTEKIRTLQPDLILCVGDIIDNTSLSDASTLSFLEELTNIADVYMSLGNHEIDYYQDHPDDYEHLSEIGVNVLEETYVDLAVNGQAIRLGGMYGYAFSQMTGGITQEDMHNSPIYQFLSKMQDTDAFQLMMAHRPDSFIYGEAYRWDFDLILSGHNHGGQVIIPFVGGLYAPEEGFFPFYDYGLFSTDNSKLIVSRGISSSNEYLPRLNNPCEIVEIVLR